MVHSNTNQHKSGGSSTVEDKSALVVVALPSGDDRVLDATHHIVSDDGTVSIYLGERSDGIDVQADLSRCVIARSQAARDALDVDAGGDTGTDEESRTGGHADDVNAFREFRNVDYVEYDGDGYRVFDVLGTNTLAIDQPMKRPIEVPADECTPTDEWGNPLDGESDDDEKRLMTDGGRSMQPEQQRDAMAAAWGATAANGRRLPYELDYEVTRHDRTVYAVCQATGEKVEIRAGSELELAPVTCPVCGGDDECQDLDGQSTLDGFGAGNGGEF